MSTGKTGLSHDIYLLVVEGHLRKVLWVALCNCIYLQGGLAFIWQGMVLKEKKKIL
jgi:hypothetical protein